MVFGRWDRVLGWCFGFWVGFRWLGLSGWFLFFSGGWVFGGCGPLVVGFCLLGGWFLGG